MPKIVAFVTGISTYEKLIKLPHAKNAAKALAMKLKGLGAKVHEVYDCHFEAFKKVYRKFLGDINAGDIVIVFFAGHGCQWKKAPLLITSVMDPDDLTEEFRPAYSIHQRSKNVHQLQDDLRRKGTALNVILLDCCGNFTHNNRGGFERIDDEFKQLFHIDTDEKTIIGFSCSPGDQAYEGKGAPTESGYGTPSCIPHSNIVVIHKFRCESNARSFPLEG